MQRALLLALCSVLFFSAGCASKTRAPKPATADKNSPAAPAIQPSPAQVMGRVIAIDARSLSVIVELGPYATPPFDLSKYTLLCRTDDLRPTARLQASPYLRGRTLGAKLIAGRPQLGDEVILGPLSQ